jgi:hypothetical protein
MFTLIGGATAACGGLLAGGALLETPKPQHQARRLIF